MFSVVLLVLGLLSSLLNMLWDITLYHVISDGQEQDIKRQLKMLPYYFVHFAFRSFSLATFFIYWRVNHIPALIHALSNIKISNCVSRAPLLYFIRS